MLYGGASARNGAAGIGSIKTNIGHLEAAAGVAGLLRWSSALEKKRIPPHLHLKQINPSPYIEWDSAGRSWSDFVTDWAPKGSSPRIAGVSRFGFGGTNAHVIVEEAPAPAQSPKASFTPEPAGRHESSLCRRKARRLCAIWQLARGDERLLEFVRRRASSLADVCFTANAGRAHFAHRLSVTGESKGPIRQALQSVRSRRGGPEI